MHPIILVPAEDVLMSQMRRYVAVVQSWLFAELLLGYSHRSADRWTCGTTSMR